MALSSHLFHSQRTKALDNLAYEMNYDFRRKDKYDFFRLLKEFELCKTHRYKKARNIISKTDAWQEEEVFIFDYIQVNLWPCFWLKDKHKRQTVFFVVSRHLELPELLIKPRPTIIPKQWELLSRKEIRFDHHPEFDNKYLVRGENEALTKKMVNKYLIHFLTHLDGWTIESLNFLLVIYKQNDLVPPEEIPEFLESCMEIYHRFKVPLR